MRYNDIANKIQPEKFSSNTFYVDLIMAYKNFCYDLHSLAEVLPITEEYDFSYELNGPLLNRLNNVKLAEGYQKMRASHFFLTYTKPFEFVECSYGINNQKVTMTFAYPLKNGYKIGIQLEDNQFRRFVLGKNHRQFANNVIQIQYLFDSNWKSPREKLLFLGYNPDFTYQYTPITTIRTYSDLSKEINDVLLDIHNNKDRIENQIP
jgi:hypothetical protein